MLATKRGLVKKTRLEDYDTNRSAGVIAINLREGDELVSAQLVSETDDLMLVSRKGQSLRFTATDEALRPMGRATSGVTGMKFREDDELLAADVVARRTPTSSSSPRAATPSGPRSTNTGSRAAAAWASRSASTSEERGDLVGALIVQEEDEVLVVMEGGKVVRSSVAGVPAKGRDTMGVIFAKPDKKDRIIAVARNTERDLTVLATTRSRIRPQGRLPRLKYPRTAETGAAAHRSRAAETTMTATESTQHGDSEPDAETENGGNE